MLRFVWDPLKRQTNLRLHGVDFDDVHRFEWETADIGPSYPSRLGSRRFIATGLLDGDLVTTVFSPLGTEAYSIISMRRASRRERRKYAERET